MNEQETSDTQEKSDLEQIRDIFEKLRKAYTAMQEKGETPVWVITSIREG